MWRSSQMHGQPRHTVKTERAHRVPHEAIQVGQDRPRPEKDDVDKLKLARCVKGGTGKPQVGPDTLPTRQGGCDVESAQTRCVLGDNIGTGTPIGWWWGEQFTYLLADYSLRHFRRRRARVGGQRICRQSGVVRHLSK